MHAMEFYVTISVLYTFLISFYCINYVVMAQNPSFRAIYQFGDSISDTGNDVQLDPNGACGKRPYGRTFFQQRPTGRCSNGLLMVDYFARALKLPLIHPYLNKSGDFNHGANFAVAGATALNTSGTSLYKQLGWFKSHLSTICTNQAECKQKLGNSLFLMGEVGGNDYNAEGFGQKKTPQQLADMVPLIVMVITGAVKQLIDLGATKIVVPGNFPVGCMTIYLAAHKTSDPTMYDELGCLKNWNELAAKHNNKLQSAITTLQQQNPGVKIVYADNFGTLRSIFQNPESLGFEKDGIHKACCGNPNDEYNFGGCGLPSATVCPNPNVRVSWDGIHLTQHAYQVMAKQLLKQLLPALS